MTMKTRRRRGRRCCELETGTQQTSAGGGSAHNPRTRMPAVRSLASTAAAQPPQIARTMEKGAGARAETLQLVHHHHHNHHCRRRNHHHTAADGNTMPITNTHSVPPRALRFALASVMWSQ
jgi:hypothetical protein